VGEIAAEQGFGVAQEWATPAELAGSTVWALNSLHGIREVTSWIDGPQLASDLPLLAQWREQYTSRATPLTDI